MISFYLKFVHIFVVHINLSKTFFLNVKNQINDKRKHLFDFLHHGSPCVNLFSSNEKFIWEIAQPLPLKK